MTDDLRALLNDVAEGRIAPARAAQLIDDLPPEAAEPAAETAPSVGRPTSSAGTVPTAEDRVERVRITASARPVRVVGDHTVATVTVDGPHSVRREGNILRVEAGSPVGAAAAAQAGDYTFERKTGLSRWLAQSTLVGVPLTVRINPDLATDVEVMAGPLQFVGLRGPISFSVTAGSVQLHDCSGPFTGVVRAGSGRLEVRPTTGHSSLRVESGSVDLRLQKGSAVRLTGHAELGEIKVDGGDGSLRASNGGDLREVLVGSGTATLELAVVMGSAKVQLP